MSRLSWPLYPESGNSNGTEIIVLCDGTGKNGRVDKDPTNVYWLYSLLGAPLTNPDGSKMTKRRKRKLFYIPGVGAESKGIPKYLALVFGKTIVEMVIKAYMFIAENYRPGDTVWYPIYVNWNGCELLTMKQLVYSDTREVHLLPERLLVSSLGIVGSEKELLAQWQRREKPVPWDQVKDTKHSVPVRCLGVWDTVGAIYSSPESEEKDLLGMPDGELPPNVELALHVVAYHENRKRFRVTLFEPNGKTDLKEANLVSRISLIWMIGEIRAFMDISDNERLRYPFLADLEPSDAYNESPAWKRAVDKCETRLESKALQSTAKVHQTLRDIKQEVNHTSHGGHRQLTFHDLFTLRWNIQKGLVLCNKLEVLKQALSASKAMRREQLQRDRTRAMSLPSFNSRPHTLSMQPELQVADVLTGQLILKPYEARVDGTSRLRISN
ncbi:unnamed protein product [Rhizoctonia solani]|uniref:T6SS Phospholipase effector Tle1-like catalytic domain-containing protein n=1 Tax=Rhizoctonia solani TaxID=456999 RepID=A0A8H3CWH6_9AGAM|nr:unnamed protein product [Rhizoctonia solani]